MKKPDYKSAFHDVLNAIVRRNFGIESENKLAEIDWDWEITDEEAIKVMNSKDYFNIDYDELIERHFHIDSKTGRLISDAYIMCNNTRAFGDVNDALMWINAQGNSFDSWQDLMTAVENKDIDECWHSVDGFTDDEMTHSEKVEMLGSQ